jgi:threonine dehydrogenase-like Zn-dependent dehydrogenase
MCDTGLQTQCETTQVRSQGSGAPLFGYTKLYGQVPGGQAEYLRVPQAQYGPIKVPEGPADDRFVYLSDVLPTAWQAVQYADVPAGGTVAVLGLGPIGDMSCRIALHQGAARVIGVDLVPERLERARQRGVDVLDLRDSEEIGDVIRDLTDGRGPDAVIDAVGMEAHGDTVGNIAHKLTALVPDKLLEKAMKHTGIDRMGAIHAAIDIVRRGGTISLSGVYGGMSDPMPMLTMFDKQIQLRMGQANVRRWVDDILPLLTDADPLGVDDFATHRIPISQGPEAYSTFQKKQDGAIKYLVQPGLAA